MECTTGPPNENSRQISAPQPAYSWLARKTEQIRNQSWQTENITILWNYNQWKNSWDARSFLVFVFHTAIANFRPCFSNNNVHVAWTLLQPISLPYLHQTMLRGTTRKLTSWLLSTLYRERGGKIQLLSSNRPNTFFNDCLWRLVSRPGCCLLFFVFLLLILEFARKFTCLQPTLYPFI